MTRNRCYWTRQPDSKTLIFFSDFILFDLKYLKNVAPCWNLTDLSFKSLAVMCKRRSFFGITTEIYLHLLDVHRPQSAYLPGGFHPWPVGCHLRGRCYILLGFPGSPWGVFEWWEVIISYMFYKCVDLSNLLVKHLHFNLLDMQMWLIPVHLPAWATH